MKDNKLTVERDDEGICIYTEEAYHQNIIKNYMPIKLQKHCHLITHR